VQDCVQLFVRDWHMATGEKTNVLTHAGQSGNVQLLRCGPHYQDDVIYNWLAEKIYHAKRSLYVATPYFVPDETLVKALELATKRGVQVHFLVPGVSNHRLADLSRDALIPELKTMGVKFHFFPQMLHAKLIIIDEQDALLGSANFDCRSLLINFEAGFALTDQALIEKLIEWFNEKTALAPEPKFKDSWWRPWLTGTARLLSPIL